MVNFIRYLPLRHKMALLLGAVFFGIVSLATAAFVFFELRHAFENRLGQLRTVTQLTAFHSEAAIQFSDRDAVHETLAALGLLPFISEALLVDASGGKLGVYSRATPTEGWESIVPGGTEYVYANGQLTYRHPVLREGKPIGTLFVRADLSDLASLFNKSLAVGAAVLVIAMLVTLALSKLMQRYLTPLVTTIGTLKASSETLRTSAERLAAEGKGLAAQAQQQATAIQQTLASMGEMRASIGNTTNAADQSLNLTKGVTEKTASGSQVMEQMAIATEEVQQASVKLRQMSDIFKQIASCTSIINNIVFKTQILSFNAAIEAARAGTHGRGFAVVAEEVGKLAEMSGAAANQIEDLLSKSKKEVEQLVEATRRRSDEGHAVTKSALARFQEIAEDIYRISSQIGSITEAAREHEASVGQTTTAIRDIDHSAQESQRIAASASQTAVALQDQAGILGNVVEHLSDFVLGDNGKH